MVTLPETDFTLVIDEEKRNDGKKIFLKLLRSGDKSILCHLNRIQNVSEYSFYEMTILLLLVRYNNSYLYLHKV